MYLTYKFLDTGSSQGLEKVIISPDNANMTILSAMVNRPDMKMKNPARVFVENYKSGLYEDLAEEELAAEAYVANELADAWGGHVEENIFTVLANLSRMYICEKKKTELPDVFEMDDD